MTATVTLYLADVSQMPGNAVASTVLLSEAERIRAMRFRRVADRNRFVAGRTLIRSVLAPRIGCYPGQLDFRFSERGKPYLTAGPSFNLSHSGNSVLLGVCEHGALGVDIEMIADWEDRDAVAQRVFSDTELAQYERLTARRRMKAFFRGWTRKEAFVKALGVGITVDLKAFDVSLSESSGNTLIDMRCENAQLRSWCIRTVSLVNGAEIAVALDEPQFDVTVEDSTAAVYESRIVNS